MTARNPVRIVALAGGTLVALLAAGALLDVGPLSGATPPDQVTDPKEMVARSLQATIDATSVHLEGEISGMIPGALVERPEPTVSLDGSTLTADLRPKDGKTALQLVSPGLDVDVDTVTVWDGVWYRPGPDDPWERASLGGASAEAGVDINPLTLVDRLRGFLATPGIEPELQEVTCASGSGVCHRIAVDAGRDPATILKAMLPPERAAELPPVRTTIVLDTDAQTLRPAHLVLDAVSDDGTIAIHVEIDATDWDSPEIVIEEPSTGP